MFSLFGSKKRFNPDQFEEDLKKISSRILKTEKNLRSLYSNKSYYSKALPIYLIGIYLSFVGYVYFSKKKKWTRENILIGTLSPIICFLTYYILRLAFNYMINQNEAYLETLRGQHKEKLDELKEQTNFYKTNELLTRFSNGEDFKELEVQAMEIEKKKQEYLKLIKEGKLPNPGAIKTDGNGNKIYDGFLKFMLGEDELSADTRYALICSNCFQHNGLAAPGLTPDKVKYVCPRCGVLNGDDSIETEGKKLGDEVKQEIIQDEEKSISTKDSSTAIGSLIIDEKQED